MAPSKQNRDTLPVRKEETAQGGRVDGELVSRLRDILPHLLQRQPVSLAYLYGSTATGLTHPFSDVDIALVVYKPVSPRERLKLMLDLQRELDEQYDISNADVRVINDAPLVFQGRVVTEGISVYARDEAARIEFETTTRLRYFDYLPIHRRLQDAFFDDVMERGLYGRSRKD